MGCCRELLEHSWQCSGSLLRPMQVPMVPEPTPASGFWLFFPWLLLNKILEFKHYIHGDQSQSRTVGCLPCALPSWGPSLVRMWFPKPSSSKLWAPPSVVRCPKIKLQNKQALGPGRWSALE